MNIEVPHNWTPRPYQIDLYNHFEPDIPGQRGVAVWHRRGGKDLTGINIAAKKIVQRWEKPGLYWHLLPTYQQGRKIVWNGFDREGRAFLDYFPKELIKNKLNNEMRLHFLNGSIYQVVGTDDVGSLVGANPVGCIFSEYSLQDPMAWKYISPILRENGGWAMFIMTFRGRNHGWKLYQMAKNNPKWFCDLRTAGDLGTTFANGQPVVTDAEINEERASGISEEIIQQEYYCNPSAGLEGSYYGSILAQIEKKGQITGVPYDPMLKVDTAWDLGMRDNTCIVFFQRFGFETRVIDYYENSGRPLAHYKKVLDERDYDYGTHYAPHDIQVRELTSGRTRLDTAREMGLRFTVTPKHELEDGIENARNVLPMCWFDSKKTERLVEALGAYTKESEPEKRWRDDKSPLYRDTPLHNWASHPADAFRYMSWWCRRPKNQQRKLQTRVEDDFQYV